MQKRITLDWDWKHRWLKIIGISAITWHRNTLGIILKPSVKKGYHVIVWLREPISDEEHFKLRTRWRDDKNRIKLDRERLKRGEPINILFTSKKDFYYTHK